MVPMVMLLALLLGGGAGYALRRGEADATQRRAKARHFYMLGVEANASDRNAEASEYYRRAYEIDPAYPEAQMMHGMYRVMAPVDTLMSDEEMLRSLKMVGEYVHRYPGDQTAVDYYVALANAMDTIPEVIRVYERLDSIRPGNSGTYLRLAQAYRDAGKIDSVISMLNRYQRVEGMSPHITMQKTAFRLLLADTLGAIEEVKDLIESNPRKAEYHVIAAKAYELLGDTANMVQSLHTAEALDGQASVVKRSLAEYYLSVGDTVQYDRKIYEALLGEDLELQAKLGIMATYLQRIIDNASDTRRGDELFATLREQYPLEPELLYLAARYEAAKRNLTEARELMGYVTDLDGSNPEYWQSLIMYDISDDAPQQGVADYRKAASKLEERSGTLMLIGATAYAQAGMHRDAIAVYDTIVKLEHPSISIYDTSLDRNMLRTLSYEQLMRIAAAFQMAGDEYQNIDSLAQTYRCYDISLRIDPDNALVLNNYAYFIIEKDPSQPDADQIEKARTMVERAVELEPQNPTYLDTYAWLLYKEGDYEKAAEEMRKAIDLAHSQGDESAEYYHHMGDILYFAGDNAGALAEWEKALKLTPDDTLLKRKVKEKTYVKE